MVLKRQANIIITGTPGTGKSSHAQLLVEKVPELKLIDVNVLAKEKKLYSGFDEERQSHIVDDDKLLDVIEDDLDHGNQVIDWHVADVFPESLIDLVVVLRTENGELYKRLEKREYAAKKIEENIDAEIMEVILNDVRETYDQDIIVELDSNTIEEVEANVDRIAAWYKNWNEEHPEGVSHIDFGPSDDSDDSSADEGHAKRKQARAQQQQQQQQQQQEEAAAAAQATEQGAPGTAN